MCFEIKMLARNLPIMGKEDSFQGDYFLQGWSEPWCLWRQRDKLILLLLICARKMFQLPAFMGKCCFTMRFNGVQLFTVLQSDFCPP